MAEQPEHDEPIIQCDRPYDNGYMHYPIGMRRYYQTSTFQEVLDYCEKTDWPKPDFWWISAKDFPFPDKINDP